MRRVGLRKLATEIFSKGVISCQVNHYLTLISDNVLFVLLLIVIVSRLVKHIIRKKATRLYLSADEKWVSDCRFAQDFQSVQLVISEAQRLMLKDVEMVLLMSEQPSEYDVTLPLFSSRHDRAGMN